MYFLSEKNALNLDLKVLISKIIRTHKWIIYMEECSCLPWLLHNTGNNTYLAFPADMHSYGLCMVHIEGVLTKGPYLPCVSMTGRAV